MVKFKLMFSLEIMVKSMGWQENLAFSLMGLGAIKTCWRFFNTRTDRANFTNCIV